MQKKCFIDEAKLGILRSYYDELAIRHVFIHRT